MYRRGADKGWLAGRVTISRALRATTFPADFILVAAMNPCPCGVTVHESRATSVQEDIEPRRYFRSASVDQTEARKPTVKGHPSCGKQAEGWPLRLVRKTRPAGLPPGHRGGGSKRPSGARRISPADWPI
jgi:hypothetical protein